MAKRMEKFSVSYKATQEINKIIDSLKDIIKDTSDKTISTNDFIKEFNKINLIYNNARKSFSESLENIKNGFNETIKSYFNKQEQDDHYLTKASLNNAIFKNQNLDYQHKLTVAGDNKITGHKNGNTLMTLNGVKLIIDGDWLKLINPDGSELYAKNINTGTQRSLGEDIFQLKERTYIPAAWNEIPNSSINNIGGTVQLPAKWNDLVLIVDNTYHEGGHDLQNDHRIAPAYVYMCRAEVPIKFLTPYSTVGVEVTASYVKLTQKTGPVFTGYNQSRNNGNVMKVLWR
jgi:hypothetical protein|nr:MAG TPA: hypothetical protein [Caudoviricetes sp.]